MTLSKLNRSSRAALVGLLMLSFVLRALVPQGFMPSAGNPFVLQICPDGLQQGVFAALTAHGAHSGDISGMSMDMPDMDMSDHAGDEAGPAPSHQHSSASSEHCLFGAGASGTGPITHTSIQFASIGANDPTLATQALPVVRSQRFRLAQPRGPPFLA